MRKVKTMPKQLDRIQKAKEYYHHPLRKEYEAKKAEITKKNKGLLYYLGWIFVAFSWIMVPGYLVVFILDDEYSAGSDHTFLIIIFGLINLVIALAAPFFISEKIKTVQENRNKDELNKLINEYNKKGLYEFTEKDLTSSCLDKDYDGDPICGVTGAYIGYGQKYHFCKTPGNCLKCKTFMKAYLGNDWDGEYEME